MESLITFLANNTLWFLIIILLLVFALIGYLVDSKNPENKISKSEKIKKVKKKKEKPEKKEPETLESLNMAEIENLTLNDTLNNKKSVNKVNDLIKTETPVVPTIEDAPVVNNKDVLKK